MTAVKQLMPFVDIIIPVFNEEKYISACLLSVKNLDYPVDRYKVTIVDNGSTDRSVELAKKQQVRIIEHIQGKVGAVRNRGVNSSSGDIVAFLDADCLVGDQWLRAAVYHLDKDFSLGAVGGTYTAPEIATWQEKAWDSNSGEIDTYVDSLAAGSFLMRRWFCDWGGRNRKSAVLSV